MELTDRQKEMLANVQWSDDEAEGDDELFVEVGQITEVARNICEDCITGLDVKHYNLETFQFPVDVEKYPLLQDCFNRKAYTTESCMTVLDNLKLVFKGLMADDLERERLTKIIQSLLPESQKGTAYSIGRIDLLDDPDCYVHDTPTEDEAEIEMREEVEDVSSKMVVEISLFQKK